MDDLISRQAAIEAVSQFFDKAYIEDADIHKNDALYELSLVPSAQPERKKGRWIDANEGKWNTIVVFKCSVCGEVDSRIYESDNFCPNCGADMRGEKDGN